MPERFTNSSEEKQSHEKANKQIQGAIGELGAQLEYLYKKYDRQKLTEVRDGLSNVRLTLIDLDHALDYLIQGESILSREITDSLEF